MNTEQRGLLIYCCGSIAKGTASGKQRWTDAERQQVRDGAAPTTVSFLNPDDPITDPGNTQGQFGRDLYQIYVASAVIVDARERRGLGVGVEMATAATLGLPVITVAPEESHYRRSNVTYRGVTVEKYIHPHLACLSTVVVSTFEEAGLHAAKLGNGNGFHNPWLTDSIREYRDNMLRHDEPMKILLDKAGRTVDDN